MSSAKQTDSVASPETTHFGFQTVKEADKAGMVKGVFNSVADQYDLMNDVMTVGIHRVWKNSMIDSLNPRAGMKLLDVAGGTGDIAFRFLDAAKGGHVTVCDINAEMLRVGQQRAIENGYDSRSDFICGDAMKLPFANKEMDAYTIAFGIRNVTRIHEALEEAYRVLKPGGKFLCLEFSPTIVPILQKGYDAYSFNIMPKMGELIANDRDSYQYLAESIRRFPTPERFETMIKEAGFSRVSYRTMTAGFVAIHSGTRI
ncbi:MAG: bifunctional demethylmenaquinone methyltransferase/2-methoxy-6-polyprenyl-1,4-benzoquinol methylase UbiE [Kordiimonadaceae bacterium]|nr:bifunctional demethylmenaquinone methyltransferase/2-methoxy-6-polyprenyl-1,4-benzoquinol methylase UbiE [Kordiimonadaceae bacterium]